jgi:CBS domain-containing protein
LILGESELNASTKQTVTPVREIMSKAFATTSPDSTVVELAQKLLAEGISGVPVVDEQGALVGMVSEYDVVSKRGRTVGDIMSRGVISIDADADAEQAADLMGLHGIRRVPVLDSDRLVGVVSRRDLLRLFATTSWICESCSLAEHGFSPPTVCPNCGSERFSLVKN